MPPVIVPPEISTRPSVSIAAYNPAFDIFVSKSPSVVEVPTVIVVYSLLEFLTITVWLSLISTPKSLSKVSDVAVVV